MNDVSKFLKVLTTAVAEFDRTRAGRASDYWDTIGAVLKDQHFIKMIVAEMTERNVAWQLVSRTVNSLK